MSFGVILIICFVIGAIWGIVQISANNKVLNDNIAKQENIVKKQNITISKELVYRTVVPRWFWRYIIDEPQQCIHIIDACNQMVSIPISKLIGCEVFQDNETTGGIKRAIVGGVLAGGAGAIVGANTAKTKITSFVLMIYQDDLSVSQIPMVLIDTETKKNHPDFINANAFASEVIASIKVLLHRQEANRASQSVDNSFGVSKRVSKIEELKEPKQLSDEKTISEEEFDRLKTIDSPRKQISSSISSYSENAEETEIKTRNGFFSEADEIRKFRELADKGIITEEEFEAKKRQLLGLYSDNKPRANNDDRPKQVPIDSCHETLTTRIFYCPNCNKGFLGTKKKNCPVCKSPTEDTRILYSDWKGFSKEKKEDILQDFAKSRYGESL